MCFTGFPQGVEDDVAGDAAMHGDRECLAGVVIEPVEDLHIRLVGQPPVGEVRLPALIGLLGGKPDVGGFGPLLRGGGDQTGRAQVPMDGVHRNAQPVVVFEVPGDGMWSVVEALLASVSRS